MSPRRESRRYINIENTYVQQTRATTDVEPLCCLGGNREVIKIIIVIMIMIIIVIIIIIVTHCQVQAYVMGGGWDMYNRHTAVTARAVILYEISIHSLIILYYLT